MKTVTRHKAFETNSSSTHSICVCDVDEGLIKLGFEAFNGHTLYDIGSGEYGWEVDDHYGFIAKLDYLYLYLDSSSSYRDGANASYRSVAPLNEFNKDGNTFLAWLKSQFEERGFSITLETAVVNEDAEYSWERGTGYIDHQSIPGDFEEEILRSQKAVLNYLFNDKCYVHTDNDNH